jgi:hypothetical protein
LGSLMRVKFKVQQYNKFLKPSLNLSKPGPNHAFSKQRMGK